jgi:hypothetical protein
LPFSTLEDLEILSRCGYMDLPNVAKSILPDIPPPDAPGDGAGMPDVGGILPQDKPIVITALAIILSIILPMAGIIKLRQKRLEDAKS